MINLIVVARVLRGLVFLLTLAVFARANGAEKITAVPKWSRFEQAFRSSADYFNPPQACTLKVAFFSPDGTTNEVEGFWDGGAIWRVRFSPDQPGRWTYQTTCSDPANRGLHDRSGTFLCIAAAGTNRFRKHGPVRVGRDGRYLEHADGTSFFWLGDAAWHGPRLASAKNWDLYASVRANQKFSVIQWRVAPETDFLKQTAFTGHERISINPDFFRRLDAKVEALNRAGLLSVIQPFLDIDERPGEDSDPDQTALLVRYMIARWGAHHVAWLVAGDDSLRWKRIGRAAFQGRADLLVVAAGSRNVSDDFRDEPWVDAFGIATPDQPTTKEETAARLVKAWNARPTRPLVNLALPIEHSASADGSRITADDVRREAWQSLLRAPPAGVTYSANAVIDWNATVDPPADKSGNSLPLWHKSLFLPGAKQMAHLAELTMASEFRRLRPAPNHLLLSSGVASAPRQTAAAATEANDFSVIYVSEERIVELSLKVLPSSPVIRWLNPRTGAKSPAVAVVGLQTCQFPTPGPGDWVLLIQRGR